MNERLVRTKGVSGPGGVNCPCCRVGSKQDAKRLHKRIMRRRSKESIREMLAAV